MLNPKWLTSSSKIRRSGSYGSAIKLALVDDMLVSKFNLLPESLAAQPGPDQQHDQTASLTASTLPQASACFSVHRCDAARGSMVRRLLAIHQSSLLDPASEIAARLLRP